MSTDSIEAPPSPIRYVLGFLVVGIAWGFTTPFMRRAALNHTPKSRPILQDPNISQFKRTVLGLWYSIVDLLSRPNYLVPLALNLSGSVWFFLLVGQAELSLSVPITNSCAFLFTVLGEWWAEGKIITKETWLGMMLVLGGIALCVQSKLNDA